MPTEKPVLVDEDGNQVKTFFGPYFEGEKASISCEVSGGKYIKCRETITLHIMA